MSVITAQQIRMAAKTAVNDSNMNSVLVALDRNGAQLGMDKAHRAVQYLGQLMHESGDFRYDRELWGPTPAQKGYDTRADLGNTPAVDGDGYLYRGRTGIELTGRSNYAAFLAWCRKKGLNPPDFVRNPDAVNTDPWEGLAPLWYWETHNLNTWADQGDIETLTKKINGGMNGFADRVDHVVRLSLVVLGYEPAEVREFQTMAKRDGSYAGSIDGDAGPKTRAALHAALVRMTPGAAADPAVRLAPVTEVKPVVPPEVEAQVRGKTNLFAWIFGGGLSGSTIMSAMSGADWRTVMVIAGVCLLAAGLGLLLRHQLIAAIRDIRTAAEG